MDKYTLMSRAGIWNKQVIEESHINESQYKVAGQPVTLNKGETSDGTDWTVTFKNNVEVPLSDVLALIDPMPSGISKTNVNEANRGKVYKAAKQGSYPGVVVVIENGKVIHQEPVATPDVAPATFNVMQQKYPKALLHLEDKTGKRLYTEQSNINESQWADQVKGNDEIVWVKTKEMGSRANYTPFYRGHEFDKGGYTFGSQDEMDRFVKDYILSNQMYNKLKHEPIKPIKINEVEQGETGLMVSGRNSIDNNKIGEAIESLGFHAEWNREGFWFLEEEQDMYDGLEYILTKEFDKQNLQNYTIEGIW